MADDKPDDKPDVARLVDEAAKAIGLAIAPEYRANVILNYERSLVIGRPIALAASPTRRAMSGFSSATSSSPQAK